MNEPPFIVQLGITLLFVVCTVMLLFFAAAVSA